MLLKNISSCTFFFKDDLNWYCKMKLFRKEYFGFLFYFILVESYINSTTKNRRINLMFKNVIYKKALSLCFVSL